MMTILYIIVSMMTIFFLYVYIEGKINKTVLYTEKIWLRKLFSKRALKIVEFYITRNMSGLAYPLIIKLHFNKEKYRKYYVTKGFDFTLRSILKNFENSVEQKKKGKEYFFKNLS